MDGKITTVPLLLLPYYKEYKLGIEKTKFFSLTQHTFLLL